MAAANFGSRAGGSSGPSGGGSVPASVAQRLRDCDQAHTRLTGLGDGATVDVTAPWAGDRHTLGVEAAPGETARELADRIRATPEFRRAGDPVDSITLLTSTGIGAELHRELTAAGVPVRVYESSTSLTTEPGFAVDGGGHWVVHGGLTATHELAVAYELIRAQQTGFEYVAADDAGPGSVVALDDRAGTLALLRAALAASNVGPDGVLDLTGAARSLSRAEHPAPLWHALMRLLRGQLGGVREVVDLVRDTESGQWQPVTLPIAVRRLFTATGAHVLEGDRGRRAADFNRPDRLLSGAAAERPDNPEALAGWLAETAVDRVAQGRPLPAAHVSGETADLQRAVIARLRELGVGAHDARAWADLMVNGIHDPALPAQITVGDDAAVLDAEPEYGDDRPATVTVPLGGGVHEVLREVLAEEPAALNAAYDVAAHYLHDQTGSDVSAEDAADIATMSWRVATLVEVIAVTQLSLQALLDPDRTLPVTAHQTPAFFVAAAGPDLRGFLATHEDVIRQAVAAALPAPRSDVPLWETPVGETTTLGDALRELLDPEQAPAGNGVAGPAPVPGPGSASGPWHLPQVDLVLPEQGQPGPDLVAAAIGAASLLTELDTTTEAGELANDLAAAATRSAALRRLSDLLDRAGTRHPELQAAVGESLRSFYRDQLASWLASALTDSPRWEGPADDSAGRVGAILGAAGLLSPSRADWTTRALAQALGGAWRDITAGDLWGLPPGTVTLLGTQQDGVVLVERSVEGLTLVEPLAPIGAEITRVTTPAAVVRSGPLRVVVDADDRVVGLTPETGPVGVTWRPSTTGGLAAPNFGGPAVRAARPLPVPPAPEEVPSVPITAALANLHVLLEQDLSGTRSEDSRAQNRTRAAREFGEEFAARLASQLADRTIDPHDVVAYLDIESVSVVRGYASLAFLQAAAVAEGTGGQEPIRSATSLAGVLDRMGPADPTFDPDDPHGPHHYTAAGAQAFLRVAEQQFRERLAQHLGTYLGRPVSASDVVFDLPGAVPGPGNPPGSAGPASIDLLVRVAPVAAQGLAEQYGPASASARTIYEQSRGASGQDAERDRRFDEHKAAPGPGDDPAAEPSGSDGSPRRLANGAWAYLPAAEDARAELLDFAAGFPAPDATVTVAGVLDRLGAEIAVRDGHGSLRPDQLIADQFTNPSRQPPTSRPILLLRLLGDEGDAIVFGELAQHAIDGLTRRELEAPRGLVVESVQPSGSTSYYAVAPGSRVAIETESLDEAMDAVRAQEPEVIDLPREMYARMNGYRRAGDLFTVEVVRMARRRAVELPGYSERAGAAIESHAETEVRVPVRSGAEGFEVADTARLWLNPQAIREAVPRGTGTGTVRVRIGPGLRAHVHRLPAGEDRPEAYATTISVDEALDDTPYRVWVNRHEPLDGPDGATMTVVPLPPFGDVRPLSQLPDEILSHVTVEPGPVVRGRVRVGDEVLTAEQYAARLPAGEQNPIIVLTSPRVNDGESAFVRELSRFATVLQALPDHRSGWDVYRHGDWHAEYDQDDGGLAAALRASVPGAPTERPSLGDAMEALRSGALTDPNAPEAREIRRGMLVGWPRESYVVRGWVFRGEQTEMRGSIADLLAEHPSGLVVLEPQGAAGRNGMVLTVPARFVSTVRHGQTTWPVVDLAALVAAGARVRRGGHVIVPVPATAQTGARVVVEHLDALRHSGGLEARAAAEQLFETLSGVPAPAGGSAVPAWAVERFGAPFRGASVEQLENLGAGSVTPVLGSRTGLVFAVGSDRPDRPRLMSFDGEDVDLAEGEDLQLLLDDHGRLAQIDLSVPGHVILDVRGRAGAADDVAAPSFEPAAARLSADDRHGELLRRLIEFVPANAPWIRPDHIELLLDLVLSDGAPEWTGSQIPDGMVRGIGSRVIARFESFSRLDGVALQSRDRRPRFRQDSGSTIGEPPGAQAGPAVDNVAPVTSFVTQGTGNERIDVIVVDRGAAHPRDVEARLIELGAQLLAETGTGNVGPRGFLVLDRVGGEHDRVYRTLARDYGLRLVLPEPGNNGRAVADRLGETRLASPSGWVMEDERGDRTRLPRTGTGTPLDRDSFPELFDRRLRRTDESRRARPAVDRRLRTALNGLPVWDGVTPDCVVRVNDLLTALGVRALAADSAGAAGGVATRLGGAVFRTTTAPALRALEPGQATVVWTRLPQQHQHLVVVVRDDHGFVLVETQATGGTPALTRFSPADLDDPLLPAWPEQLRGPIRLPVTQAGALAQFSPATVQLTAGGTVIGDRVTDALTDPPAGTAPGLFRARAPREPLPQSLPDQEISNYLAVALTEGSSTGDAKRALGPDYFGITRVPRRPRFMRRAPRRPAPATVASFMERLDLLSPLDRDPTFTNLPSSAIWQGRAGQSWVRQADVRDRLGQRAYPAGAPMVPKVMHTIWFGKPLTQRHPSTAFFRDGVRALAAAVRPYGVRTVLWTDIPREVLHRATREGGASNTHLREVAEMARWASQSGIILVNIYEVFNDAEPMTLSAEFQVEMAKMSPPGYGAASDIARLEVLYRFGGIYTDGDHVLPGEQAVAFFMQEIVLHATTGGVAVHKIPAEDELRIGNSAFVAAAGHPLIEAVITEVSQNYAAPRRHLLPPNLDTRSNDPDLEFRKSVLRRSVIYRTGPTAVQFAITSLGVALDQVPGLTALQNLSAVSWLPDVSFAPARRFDNFEKLEVSRRIAATLARNLHNAEGSLELTEVAAIVNGLPDPAGAWRAIITAIVQHPVLGPLIRSMKDQRTALGRDHREATATVELPPDVRRLLNPVGRPSFIAEHRELEVEPQTDAIRQARARERREAEERRRQQDLESQRWQDYNRQRLGPPRRRPYELAPEEMQNLHRLFNQNASLGAADPAMQAVPLYSADEEAAAAAEFDWIAHVNASTEELYATNCLDVVQAVDLSLRTGEVHVALPGEKQDATNLLGMQQQQLELGDDEARAWPMADIAEIEEIMAAAGEGARAVVVVEGSDWHAFNVTKRNGRVWMIDGQFGRLARMPHEVNSLFLVPLTPDIDRAAMPEAVSLLRGQTVAVADAAGVEDMVVGLASRLFVLGLRERPLASADLLDTSRTVRTYLDDAALGGVHRPSTWTELEGLITRSGPGGVVMTMGESDGAGAVYTSAHGTIWRIGLGDRSGETTQWTRPHDLAGAAGHQAPPLRAVAFNKCADMLLVGA